jgi:hypothetical protein
VNGSRTEPFGPNYELEFGFAACLWPALISDNTLATTAVFGFSKKEITEISETLELIPPKLLLLRNFPKILFFNLTCFLIYREFPFFGNLTIPYLFSINSLFDVAVC